MKSWIRKILRNTLLKIFPEIKKILAHNIVIDKSYTHNTLIHQAAKLYPPYHISDSKIGPYTYISRNSFISMTEIGNFCSIGPNFLCGWGIHPLNGVSTNPMFYSTQKQNGIRLSAEDKVVERLPIKIGHDVFIGANVTILDGVKIGDGAVIGAGAVVTKDIPDYAIAVGVPARVIKYRFDQDTIQKLKQTQWFLETNLEKLKLVEKHFFDVNKFIEEWKRYNK